MYQSQDNYPRSFFRQIYSLYDLDGRMGYVTPQVLRESLNQQRLAFEVTDEQVFLFFRRFNSQQDGMLTYQDLRLALAPLFIPLASETITLTNQETPIIEDD